MQNLLTPLDLFGSLVTPRQPGESLVAYRGRVLLVMSGMAHRDVSDAEWVPARERELSGHTGRPVKLVPGDRDPELVSMAERALMNWARLERHEGPFLWPRTSPNGEPTRYNVATAQGSGVASSEDLVPFYDPVTDRTWLSPGHVVVEGLVSYIFARPSRLVVPLPANTTETAVLPLELLGDHPHRFEVKGPDVVHAFGPDGHIHEILFSDGLFTFHDLNGGHAHELRFTDTDGPLFMSVGPPNAQTGHISETYEAVSMDNLVGSTLLPYLDGTPGMTVAAVTSFGGVPVGVVGTTEFDCVMDPHVFWNGTYYLPSRAGGDGIDVVNGEAAGGVELNVPETPMWRPLIPVVLGDVEPVGDHPYIAYMRYEHGFLVVSNPHGLAGPEGGTLTLVFDTGHESSAEPGHFPVPQLPARRGEIIGIGPDAPAARVHVESSARRDGALELRVRSEDIYTGGVPRQYVEARIVSPPAAANNRAFARTEVDGRGVVRVRLPNSVVGTVRVDLFVGLDEHQVNGGRYTTTVARFAQVEATPE